jgi:hypothetical protein
VIHSVVATILRNSFFCDHFLVGLAIKRRLKIYIFVDLELGQAAVLVAAAA